MVWGYFVGDGVLMPSPYKLSLVTHCHALITGASGSGKSYALLYLTGELLKDNPKTKLFFCDFKNSEDFHFLKDYTNYYNGNKVYDGVLKYYEEFCEAREKGRAKEQRILIFDEYPSCINYLTMQDKINKTKHANDILGIVSEILMLGRGSGFGIWIVTQRADASLFSNGARDNFMVVLGLGRMSKEQKNMIFAGEEVPQKVYGLGEGCLLADGCKLVEVKIPKIESLILWKKHIRNNLCCGDIE